MKLKFYREIGIANFIIDRFVFNSIYLFIFRGLEGGYRCIAFIDFDKDSK